MFTGRRLLVATLLTGVVAFAGAPAAQSPVAAFHGIGDLPGGGGAGSAVRDATRVAGQIFAVGASTVNATSPVPNPNLDTPALWTWSNGTGMLEALPYFAGVANTQTTLRSAYAITPDGAYIASQAQPTPTSTGTQWVRVTRSLLPDPSANLDLFAASGTGAFVALAISDDGLVVYGLQTSGTGSAQVRFPVRYKIGSGFSLPDLTPTGKTSGFPVPRGTTDNGRVMIGIASDGPVGITSTPGGPTGPVLGTNAVAFRYEHDDLTGIGTTSLIPVLPDGGTWNMPLAVSSTGDRTLVIGNSTSYASGEVYLTDDSNTITATLGSPNTAWMPRPLGGMTADGSVVAVTFAGGNTFGPGQISGLGIPPGNRYAYIHNSHGWFHFSSVLLSEGIDLVALGWDPTSLAITGIRTIDGVDLVFGQGQRRTIGPIGSFVGYVGTALEGFVAELPQGVLAAYNPQPVPPADQSIVGVWLNGPPNDPNTPLLTFLPDGTSYRIQSGGFERGVYTWAGNANGGALSMVTLQDTNGAGGSNRNGQSGLSITVAGDVGTFEDANCVGCTPFVPLTRVTGSPGTIVGGWLAGSAAQADNSMLVTFLDSSAGNRFYLALDQPGPGDEAQQGTYTWDPVTSQLTVTIGPVIDSNLATLSADGLGLHITDSNAEVFDLSRVIDASTIPIIAGTPLSASGIVGQVFSYSVSASNAAEFSAAGLPAGLGIDPLTGAISGTPAIGGQFDVTIVATNAVGVSDIETLTLTIAIPTPTGQNVAVEPEVPQGQGPITVTFGEVTTAGTTTVTVLDLDQSPVPPPGTVQVAGVVYEVTTTASYQGLITLCFSYAGIDFGGAQPRLFHFENNQWVDITTSVDPATETICGATTSLSPFAVLVSHVVRTGFYAPVHPLAGFLNTVKGGSTVPLKFNVTIDGVEQTSTAGLAFTVAPIACDANAPQDAVESVLTTGSGLHYDAVAGQFVQNWKVPKIPGCYLVRMTTVQDELALSARFLVR